jgi:initiation factor 1A
MAINKKGGKKHKKAGNKHREGSVPIIKNLEVAEDGQEYAKVLKKVGGSRLAVICSDGKERQAIIPGKFRKRIFMNEGDILLVSVEGIGNVDVCYIDKKYNNGEITILKQRKLINFEDTAKDDDDTACVFKKEEVSDILKIEPQNIQELNFDSVYEYYSDDETTVINKKEDSDDLNLDDI